MLTRRITLENECSYDIQRESLSPANEYVQRTRVFTRSADRKQKPELVNEVDTDNPSIEADEERLDPCYTETNIHETDSIETSIRDTDGSTFLTAINVENPAKNEQIEADSGNALLKEYNAQETDNNSVNENNIQKTENDSVNENNTQEIDRNKYYEPETNEDSLNENNTEETDGDSSSVNEINTQETYSYSDSLDEINTQTYRNKSYVNEINEQDTDSDNVSVNETNIPETDEPSITEYYVIKINEPSVIEDYITEINEPSITEDCVTEIGEPFITEDYVQGINEKHTFEIEMNELEAYMNSHCVDGIDSPFIIASNVLTNPCSFLPNKTIVKINGDSFIEEEDYGEEMVHFELVRELIYPSSDDEDSEEPFLVMKKTKQGLIFNSTIMLSEYQWNTIVISNGVHWCCVCSQPVAPLEHLRNYIHKRNLKENQPIKKFGMSITRKIKEQYHCAVCNELFTLTSDDHYTSESHKDNLDYAIIKGIDNDDVTRYRIDNDVTNTGYETDVEDSLRKAKEKRNIVINKQNNGNVTSDSGNIKTGDNGIENRLAVSGESYATVAKNVPKFVSVPVKGRQHKIDFYSWHMVLNLKTNFYCMACKVQGSLNGLKKHCSSKGHVLRLKSCDIVESRKDYIVRRVCNNFVHCGHCNNLILHINIKNHLEKILTKPHENKIENNTNNENSSMQELPSNSNGNKDNGNDNANKTDTPVQNVVINNGLHTGIIPDNDIIVQLFGYRMKIPVLSYNLVFVSQIGYFCCICRMTVGGNLITQHLIDYRHVYMLQMNPFLIEFGVNLFRLVPDGMHCTICNTLIPLTKWNLQNHIQEKMHVSLLNKALNINVKVATQFPLNKSNASKATSKLELNHKKVEVIENELKKNENKVVLLKDSTIQRSLKNNESREIDANESNEIDINQPKLNDSNSSNELCLDSSQMEDFEDEENVYLALKNHNITASITAFHSLVAMGDGRRFCFVCSMDVFDMKSHVNSVKHVNNMNDCKYLDEYSKNLIRQNSTGYHCTICNVLVTKKNLKNHLNWSIHVESDSFKTKQSDAILKRHKVETTKEVAYTYKEVKVKILFHFEYQNSKVTAKSARSHKMVAFKNKTLKLPRDSWDGIIGKKNGRRCIICQIDLDACDQLKHVNMASHMDKLERNFDVHWLPALIRKISDTAVHCLICNTEVPNPRKNLHTHVSGKRHVKNQENLEVVDEKSINKDEDIFTLHA
ncbi:uncharacterized protein LOC123704754 isoform X2 [Colias croceus]|nr:uncharacterized protein LOC123704754 isoform X2 [Colias croceus]